MPVVPDPAVDSIPRTEMLWLDESKVTPGVNLATSEKFLMPCTSILAAVKALTLTGTLLRFSSLRVAVTTISPTAVGEPAAALVEASADAAIAAPAPISGAAATPIRQALSRALV